MSNTKQGRIRLVEYDRSQAVVDTPYGRVVIAADQLRFHKNGKGRGVVLVSG
jgi:hypothetical protein